VSVHTLYGTPLSLYTGKARSYLIKNGIRYRELTPATKHYAEYVKPRAKMLMMPTLETAEGDVIRDGAAIVEHFESASGHPASPQTPRQRILSRLLDVIGMEGLLRPAMHYRWNFDEANEAFLRHHFGALAPLGADAKEVAAQGMGRMRQAAMAFGVLPDTIPGIEARYGVLLERLDRLFATQPYLLGGRPSIGDFSLIAPFYGHLGRDPKPLSLMQAKAINLFRWVERMNRPEPDVGEYLDDRIVQAGYDFFPDDEVSESLLAVLEHLAIDFVPETLAAAEFINGWLDSESDLAPGTPLQRGVGLAKFDVQGETLTAMAQPYRFYLLRRAQDEFDALAARDQKAVEDMLDACGLLPVLGARLDRGIGREDNLEIWV
jgi:glutathione S-transferase